jgi:cation diffusion facilitator family transporter
MDDTTRVKLGKKASNIALIVNVSLAVSKAIIGIAAKSTAITADALNNGTDIFATIAVFGGLRVAYLPPDENHHYGHAKAEPIVSKIVAILVMAAGFSTAWDSIHLIFSKKSETPGILAIGISIISIFAKYFLFKYTNKVGKTIESASIIADSYNHRSDVLASSAVLIGVGGARLGFPILDPAAGLIVSVIIFRTGLLIYLDAIKELMDTAPPASTIKSIRENALATTGVIQVNQIKARKQGPRLRIDLKICVNKNLPVEEGHKIASEAKSNIISNIENVQDVMIHVNPCSIQNHNTTDCLHCRRFSRDENK